MDISELTGFIDEAAINNAVQSTQQNQGDFGEFDSDTFLQIFMAQLQNQSPFDSVETKDLAQQQAILTQVEQVLRQTDTLNNIDTRLNENFTLLTQKLDEMKALLENQ